MSPVWAPFVFIGIKIDTLPPFVLALPRKYGPSWLRGPAGSAQTSGQAERGKAGSLAGVNLSPLGSGIRNEFKFSQK